MKLNKRLAASALTVILAVASANLPVLAADSETVAEVNIEESVSEETELQEEILETPKEEAAILEEVTEAPEEEAAILEEVAETPEEEAAILEETAETPNEADALEDTEEVSEEVTGTVVAFGDYSLVVDESTGRITGYTDTVEPVYSSYNFLQNPQELVIPSSINGVDITGINDEAFIGWERLGSVKIEDGVEYIGVSAFQDCGNLETVYIPDTLTYIDEYAFYDAKFLDKLVFGENPQLAVINYMAFAGCCFEELTIPESVTNIHEKAFRNCKYLEKVYFEGNAPQNLVEDENAFTNCSPYLVFYYYEGKTGYTTPTWLGHSCQMISVREGGYSLIVDKGTGRITGYIDNVEPAYSNGILTNSVDLVIPKNIDGTDITGVDEEAFYQWERVGSVTIENGVEYIGYSAFEECANIETLFVPNTVTYIDEYAFYCASSLEEVTFEENSNLAVISWMAFASTGLHEVTIPESVTNIHEKAFKNCANLTKVYFEGDAPNNIEEDENAFNNCNSDLTLYYYEGKTGYDNPKWVWWKCLMISMRTSDYGLIVNKGTGRITGYIDNVNPIYSNGRVQNSIDLVIPSNIDGTEITGIDNDAFINWERLGSVTIENGIEYIGVSAFEECYNIENVFIPNTVTCIDENAFSKIDFLEKVEFEDNSQLKTIGYRAFARSGLKEIIIPESVTNINERAFIICEDLKKVYFEGNAPQGLEEYGNAFAACNPDLVIYFYEGKTGYTTPTWLGYKCVMISTGAETNVWNFSDASLNSLGTITSNVTVGDMTILADGTNSVQVKENARTLDGVTYDYCLSLRGKGTTAYRAVKLDVTRNCTISVAAASNSDTRSLKVVKEDGTVLGTIAAGQELSIGSVEYTGRVDSLYIYSEKDNVNIYSINVTYN